jgi:MCM N-terminal domain
VVIKSQVERTSRCCRDAQAIDNEDPVLNVDCANIADSDPTLYSHLLSCPTEVIPLMDTEARNLAAALGGDEADHHIQVQGVQLPLDMLPGWQPCNNCLDSCTRRVRPASLLPDVDFASLQCCGVMSLQCSCSSLTPC